MGGDPAQERLWFLKAGEGVFGPGSLRLCLRSEATTEEDPQVVQEKAVKNPAV